MQRWGTVAVRRPPAARLAFPLMVAVAVATLSALGVSGTSVGVLSASPGKGLLLGHPRAIRSDEWGFATPLIVGQSRHGYPRYDPDGLGAHDLAVTVGTVDVPVRDWSVVFKPWDIPPLFLDLEHGFAARWWLMSAVLILGAYVLLLALIDSLGLAVLLSLALWLSPFFWWWYEAISLDTAGFGLLGAGALIHAWRSRGLVGRLLWSALAAYASVGFALLLYPPFQIPVALVVAACVTGCAIGDIRDRRVSNRQVLAVLATTTATAGLALVAYYFHVRTALSAIDSTVYPGQRRASGGGLPPTRLLSAPFEPWLDPRGLGNLGATNQSEVSSFLLLGPFAVAVLASEPVWKALERRGRTLVAALAIPLCVLTLWALVGLPRPLAGLLLLDRVEVDRAVIGIGLASLLLVAVIFGAEQRRAESGRRLPMIYGVAAATAACTYGGAGLALGHAYPQLSIATAPALIAGVLTSLVLVLAGTGRVLSATFLYAAFGLILVVGSDPVFQGLGILGSSPLLSAVESVGAGSSKRGNWISFGSVPQVNDSVVAAGVPDLGPVSLYPVAASWLKLDPGGRSVAVWDRFAIVYFRPGPSGSAPRLSLIPPDLVVVTVDPCGTALARSGVDYFVSEQPLEGSCLSLARSLRFEHFNVLMYRRTAGGGD